MIECRLEFRTIYVKGKREKGRRVRELLLCSMSKFQADSASEAFSFSSSTPQRDIPVIASQQKGRRSKRQNIKLHEK